MLNELNHFFIQQQEPNRSCYLALRKVILKLDPAITEHWKYRLPFYYYNAKPFCYFWYDKKTELPYIGIVKGKLIDHPSLIQGDRKKMKVFMIDPNKDIPLDDLYSVLRQAMNHY